MGTPLSEIPAGVLLDLVSRAWPQTIQNVELHLFGCYARESSFDTKLLADMLSKHVSEMDRIREGGTLLPRKAYDAEQYSLLSRGDDSKLPECPELEQFTEVHLRHLLKAFDRASTEQQTLGEQLLHHVCSVEGYTRNRLVCTLMQLLFNPAGVTLLKEQFEEGVHWYDLDTSAALLKERHTFVRLVKRPIAWAKAGLTELPPIEVTSMFLYEDAAMGRGGYHVSIVDEIHQRWQIYPRRRVFDAEGELSEVAYDEMERETLRDFWVQAGRKASRADFVSCRSMQHLAQSLTGHGFSKGTDLYYDKFVAMPETASARKLSMYGDLQRECSNMGKVRCTRRAKMEFIDIGTEVKMSDEEVAELSSVLPDGLKSNIGIIVTHFQKFEAGKNRLLLQVRACYDRRCQAQLHPYRRWPDHQNVMAGRKGPRGAEETLRRVFAAHHYASHAYGDHSAYNETHTSAFNDNFWVSLMEAERQILGQDGVSPERIADNYVLRRAVQSKFFMVRGDKAYLDDLEAKLLQLKLDKHSRAYARVTWRGSDVIIAKWYAMLMSAKFDTMTRNTGLGLPYFKAQSSVVAATGQQEAAEWGVKGDDSDGHWVTPYGGPTCLIAGDAVRHRLSSRKCMSGQVGELERMLVFEGKTARALARTIGSMQTRSPQTATIMDPEARHRMYLSHKRRLLRCGAKRDACCAGIF